MHRFDSHFALAVAQYLPVPVQGMLGTRTRAPFCLEGPLEG